MNIGTKMLVRDPKTGSLLNAAYVGSTFYSSNGRIGIVYTVNVGSPILRNFLRKDMYFPR